MEDDRDIPGAAELGGPGGPAAPPIFAVATYKMVQLGPILMTLNDV